MQYYDLLEAEWQGIEETNTETGKESWKIILAIPPTMPT